MPQISISFVPNRIYPELKRGHLGVTNNIISNRVPKVVEKIDDNVVVAIFSPTKKFVANLLPKSGNINSVKNLISQKIHELRVSDRCKDGDISVGIYGGISSDSKRPLADLSCRFVDAIEEGCELEEVNPTIITGQYLDMYESGFNSYIGQNHITFWGELVNKIKLGENATPAEIKKVLEELFEYVKISDAELKISEKFPDKTEHLARLQKK